jgi:hypothetical protein
MEFEKARENFEQLVLDEKDQKGRNEATTRLQLIDRVFFDCLGWSKEDAILEESHAGEYADYTFVAPRRILIVEAKKEGDYFELPCTGKNNLEYSLTSLVKTYPNLKSATKQAIGYCQERGVPFGAVSNGHQIVAFIATRSDGIPPLEGKALVFPSLEFTLTHFVDFWNILSKPAIEQKKIQSKLIGESSVGLPPKLSSGIKIYPGVKSRNPFQAEMQTLSELFIEDLPRNTQLRKEFLEDCYCSSGALSQYALISKNILQSKYTALFGQDVATPTVIPAVRKKGVSPEMFAEGLSRRPILLLGDVGVGKSEFINNLLYVEAPNVFENAINFYIDLGTKANLAKSLKDFLLKEISEQLLQNYNVDIEERNLVRGVYHSDLSRFAKGIYSDIKENNPNLFKEKELEFLELKINQYEEHIKQVLQHLAKGRNKQIIMFFDNADQRNDEIQQDAFLISQEIAEHWRPVTIFVSLRPETFYRSLKIGALSGYHPKAFTIAPPRTDQVVEKRLRFALKLSSGEIPSRFLSNNIEINLNKISELIQIFIDSLENNKNIVEFIDNIAGDNIRLALDFVRGFFGSGHVDTEKMLEKYEETGTYYVPIHEFLRAVIYGDTEYYDSDSSPIANLFDISSFDAKEHFLVPLILGFLNVESNATEEGFVDTTLIYEQMQNLSFTPEQIDFAIIRSHKKNLIETSARVIPHRDLGMPQAIRITSVGSYHISRLCYQFAYIDSILIDTPILDESIKIEVGSNIASRLKATNLFRQYLDKQWNSLNTDVSSKLFDWKEFSGKLNENVEYVIRKAGIVI